MALTGFPATAEDIVVNGHLAGGHGQDGAGQTGGAGGAAGQGAPGAGGGKGGDGGDGGAYNAGEEGEQGSGGGTAGGLAMLGHIDGALHGGGGIGGTGTVDGPGGGGGGGGGSGIVMTGAHAITVETGASVRGGDGGNGVAFSPLLGHGGGGGGGDGVTLTGSNGSRIENKVGATIAGGKGGDANTVVGREGGGGDGVSIEGDNNVVINAGSIIRGEGSNSAWSADRRHGNAISFTGDGNRLELWSTSVIEGKAVAAGSGNILALGGAADGAFDMTALGTQYLGFGALQKTGGGVWMLTGDGSAFGGEVNVEGGVLRAASATALVNNTDYVVNDGVLDLGGFDLLLSSLSGAGGEVALGAATLTVNQAIDTSFAGRISGAGAFVKAGSGVLTLSGDSSAFSGVTALQAGRLVLTGAWGGAIEAHGDSVLDAAARNVIGGFNQQTFYDGSTLNALVGEAVSGGLQTFWGASVLNAKAADAIVGGMQIFNEDSVLNALVARAVADSMQEFNDDSILNAAAAQAIYGGWQDFYDDSTLNAAAENAVVGGSQSFEATAKLNAGAGGVAGGAQGFWEDSALNALGANAIKAGQQTFRDASTLNATASHAISGGAQTFNNDSALNARAANAILGGSQFFFNTSTLNAGSGAIAGGVQSFAARSVLNAEAADAVHGGRQSFDGSSVLNARAAGAVSGGEQEFRWFATLNAWAGAVVGGVQTFQDGSVLNVLATDALATTTDIRFRSAGGGLSSGTLRLNGFSTAIGRISSLNGGAGLITNDGAANSLLSVDASAGASTFSGVIQNGSAAGRLGLTLAAGDLTLSGANAYTGGTTVNGGRLAAGAAGGLVDGTAYVINGGVLDLGGHDLLMSSLSGAGGTVALGDADLTVDQAADASFAGGLSGSGGFLKSGVGVLTLSGDSSAFAGAVTVTSGALRVDGVLGGDVAAHGLGALGGSGRIVGDVDLTGGGALLGRAGQTLRIDGAAVMDGASVLDVVLGAPSGGALFDIGGDLMLDGVLRVTDAGGFGAGVYRLFDYGGTLTDGGLEIGATPAGVDAADLGVQTAIAGRVNLISTSGVELGFWDGGDAAGRDNGIIDGGAGVWRADGRNWTQADGALNGRFNPNPTYAVFQNAGGAVTVDASAGAIGATGLQFAADGYQVTGDAIALQGAGGQSIIRVGDGTAAGAAMTATIASELTGASTLVKSDFGVLTLRGVNTYTGGTRIDAGMLAVGADVNLGHRAGAVILNGGVLHAYESFDTQRSIMLNAAGRFEIAADKTLDLGGVISGVGDLIKLGAGVLTLSGANAYAGDTLVQAGMLMGNAASIRGDVRNAGTVVFDQGVDAAFAGAIEGFGGVSGRMIKRGTGLLTLTGLSTQDWTVEAGGLIASADRFAGDAALLAGGILVFEQDADASYSGVLSGAGALAKSGAGALTLTGDSSSFIGATRVSGGVLRITGVLGGDLSVRTTGVLSGTGRIGGDVDLTKGGALAGAAGQRLRIDGDLVMDGASVVDVALGAPTGAGLFDVGGDLTLNGVLKVTDVGGFGAGIYRLFDYGGSLSGAGLVVGASPTGVAASDLAVQTAIAGQVNLVSSAGAELGFWDGGDAARHDNGAVDGGSGVWRADGRNWTQADGRLNGRMKPNPVFAVFQNAGGAVTVDASAGAIGATGLQFAADGYQVTGDAIALQGAGGQSIIRVGDGTAAGAAMTATIASELTGASTLVKSDLGVLILSGRNSYTGGTKVQAGALIGDADAIRGDIAAAGTVVFDQAVAADFAGRIGGLDGTDGLMIKRGAGELSLSGASSLDWTIEAGRLISTASRFSGDAAIGSAGGLTFDQASDGVYGGRLSGGGAFGVSGTGTVVLTGDSSTFTGTTVVGDGARLVVGAGSVGALGGAMTIGSGGLLGGTGRIGAAGATLAIAAGGIHAPGNSIGVQTIVGDYVNRGVLRIEATPIQADQIIVEGSVDIAGATLDLVLSPTDASSWDIFNGPFMIIDKRSAGAVIGRFEPTDKNLIFLDVVLDYAGGDGNDVTVELVRNDVTFAEVGVTRNQVATGRALDALGNANPLWRSIAVSREEATVREGFDALSGEIHASMKTALIEDGRFMRGAVNDRLRASTDIGEDRPAVWGQGFGAWGHGDGDGNAAGLSRATTGFVLGADATVFDRWRVGAAAGYQRSDFKVKDRASAGADDAYQLALYGGSTWDRLALRAGLAYARHAVAINRGVVMPGVHEALSVDLDATTTQAFAEVGYALQARSVAFEPFANLAHVSLRADSFVETGGTAALQGHGETTEAAFSTLGLRAATIRTLNGADVIATGMLGWRHAFGETPKTQMRFGEADSFIIRGAPIARDAAVIEAGLDYVLSPSADFRVSYGGRLGGGLSDQVFRAGLTLRF